MKELHTRGVRFVHSGSRERLSSKTLQAIDKAVELTKNNGPEIFNLAFNYGGRAELAHVAREFVAEGAQPEAVSQATIDARLWTAGLPDVDLVFRTGGDSRVSNFMLWQSAYSEFYSTAVLWPDFDEGAVDDALEAYRQRRRRFGRVTDEGG